jgi:hypothetical protein
MGGPRVSGRLAYDGDHAPGGPRATRPAHLSLHRLLADLGLGQLPDLTASGITLQTARRAGAEHGVEQAFALLGRKSSAQAYRDLRWVGSAPSTDPARARSVLDRSFPAYQGRTAPDGRRRGGAG